MKKLKIISIKKIGKQPSFNLEMESSSHNYLLSNNIVSKNSHSASYSFISYQMSWLKTYYPLEFMCACLISDSDEADKIIKYISYCQDVGIGVLGPSVNDSEVGFSIVKDSNSIRFGLSAIKNLGKPVSIIIQEREKHGPFLDILDFAKRVDLTKINKKKLECLVLSGAFDTCGSYNRASLMGAVEEVLNFKEEQKKYESKLETYNKRIAAFSKRLEDIALYDADPTGKKRPAMLKKPEEPPAPPQATIPNLSELPFDQILLNEKELMGYYISGHPLDQVKEQSKFTIAQIKEKAGDKNRVSLVAIPSVIKEITTKVKKQKMAYLELEDKTGTIGAVILPKPYSLAKKFVNITTPARYNVEVEVTEGDIGKLVRLVVLEVEELESVIAKKMQPLRLVVPLMKSIEAAKLIQTYSGGNLPVILILKSEDGSEFSAGVCYCDCNRYELAKKVKDI